MTELIAEYEMNDTETRSMAYKVIHKLILQWILC